MDAEDVLLDAIADVWLPPVGLIRHLVRFVTSEIGQERSSTQSNPQWADERTLGTTGAVMRPSVVARVHAPRFRQARVLSPSVW